MSGMTSRILKFVGLVVALSVLVLVLSRSGRRDTRPNIVLISIDTARADHLSTYGYERETSPNISKLAGCGVRYERAISQAPWTLPSVASMHTSLYPSQHGAVGAQTRLADEVETLAEALDSMGYFTVGIVSHRFAGKEHGLAQGFDIFDESQDLGHDAVTSSALSGLAVEYIENTRKTPFFLWIHYFDPHFTYIRHPEHGFASGYGGALPDEIDFEGLREALQQGRLSDRDIEFVKAVYDEEIAETDAWIGVLLDQLGQIKSTAPMVTILTADHGEYFMERGRFFHGKDVYNELVHVPLVISGAVDEVLRGSVVDRPVEIASIPRTVMRLVGADEHLFGGEDLLAPAGSEPGGGFVYTEGSYAWGEDYRKTAVISGGWKLIHSIDDDTYELYHLETDWDEQRDLWNAGHPADVTPAAQLKEKLDGFARNDTLDTAVIELDEDAINQLRSLGYVK